MSTSINIKLDFSGASTDSQCFSDSVTIDSNPTDTGKRNLAGEMFIELRRATSFLKHHRALPDSGDLLTSSTQFRRTDPMGFVDVFNVPALWLEISNTFRDLRYVLAQAKAYKQLEPPDTTPSTDDLCAYVHFEKMYKLNLAVFDLMKIQDLVVRLLQEAFSGRLIPVDYDDDDWEKKLTMKDALKGLKKLEQQCAISKEECQSVVNALAYPSQSSHRDIVIEYRNRVTHRLRPSVDYRELFTHVQNRAGKPIRDTSGAIKGRSYGIGTGGNEPEFKFDDLYAALSDYMRHVAQMLKHLKSIPRLSGASFGRE
jgi:uncharacterized protein YozE (UPF0346 family)